MPIASGEELLDLDRRLVWHPYSAMPAHLPPLPVDSAHGVRLRLQDGRELIDGMASWSANCRRARRRLTPLSLRQSPNELADAADAVMNGPAGDLDESEASHRH